MKKTILIYDDDEEILLLCKIILKKYHYNVETLSYCDDVLADVIKLKPDFILMDLWIPEMGGEKAVKIIKNHESTKQIPIFLFSANADIKDISEKVNASGYIAKPFDLKTFLEVIHNNA
jgi:DNA-binding NtrC family response regulator